MKSSITTPSSATREDRCRVAEQPQPERADGDAGGEVAEHRAEAEALEDRHGDDAGAEQGDGRDQVNAVRFDRHRGPPSCCGET